MTRAAGGHLGPGEILTPLGTGGMGEVYRARDTKLGRDVALKILPDSFTHDPERLARCCRSTLDGSAEEMTRRHVTDAEFC